jgi:hypothetical protein
MQGIAGPWMTRHTWPPQRRGDIRARNSDHVEADVDLRGRNPRQPRPSRTIVVSASVAGDKARPSSVDSISMSLINAGVYARNIRLETWCRHGLQCVFLIAEG